MSYAIGKKISEIRADKKVSQEEVATFMGISRQRLARIENGQSEISYALLLKAAEYFGIQVSDLTAADEEIDLCIYFRDLDNSEAVDASIQKIMDIIRTFHAHEKLYNRMKVQSDEI